MCVHPKSSHLPSPHLTPSPLTTLPPPFPLVTNILLSGSMSFRLLSWLFLRNKDSGKTSDPHFLKGVQTENLLQGRRQNHRQPQFNMNWWAEDREEPGKAVCSKLSLRPLVKDSPANTYLPNAGFSISMQMAILPFESPNHNPTRFSWVQDGP